MILSTIGGMLFALGMCMCLLEKWNAFSEGVITVAIGILILLIMAIYCVKTSSKTFSLPSKKAVGITILSLLGMLLLGIGMCMTMVWQGLTIQGIAIGIVGIVLLLCLIPVLNGGIK